jgi:glyoxylase-like metal-dependent hydrolase (beta-lactamase superfamily II)
VIDTEVAPTFAEAIRRKIEEVFGRSDFAYVINTHDDGDHTYGNQVFADATIIGMDSVPAAMEGSEEQRQRTIQQVSAALPRLRQVLEGLDPASERGRQMAANVAYYETLLSGLSDGFELTPPTRTFADRLKLDLGDLTVEAVYFGLAHSKSDILVFCPEEHLVATGDLFVPGEDFYIDSERVPFMGRWLENLDSIVNGSFQPDFIVPGHGDLLSTDELRRIEGTVRERQAEFAGKRSAFFAFKNVFERDGLDAALKAMDDLHSRPQEFYFLHPEFDSFVYRLMLDGDLDRAVPLFEKLAALFPTVPNAFDSLGEAYLRQGDKTKATIAFEKCLELDPENENARRRVAELKAKP